jgi:hypothetical protein
MNLVAMFSMWQLCVKDKSQLAYIGLMLLWYFIFRPLESIALQGFKMTGSKTRILIYNDDYKLNIVEN